MAPSFRGNGSPSPEQAQVSCQSPGPVPGGGGQGQHLRPPPLPDCRPRPLQARAHGPASSSSASSCLLSLGCFSSPPGHLTALHTPGARRHAAAGCELSLPHPRPGHHAGHQVCGGGRWVGTSGTAETLPPCTPADGQVAESGGPPGGVLPSFPGPRGSTWGGCGQPRPSCPSHPANGWAGGRWCLGPEEPAP